MTTVDFNPWQRFHDIPATPRVPAPLRHYYAETRQDIIDIINAAESISGRVPEVRACGSHWALSDTAVTNDFVVETQDPAADRNDPSLPRLNQVGGEEVRTSTVGDDSLGMFGVVWPNRQHRVRCVTEDLLRNQVLPQHHAPSSSRESGSS